MGVTQFLGNWNQAFFRHQVFKLSRHFDDLKVAFTGTFPLLTNSFPESYGKSTLAPPPSPASIFALNLYFFVALLVFSLCSPRSLGIRLFPLTGHYSGDNPGLSANRKLTYYQCWRSSALSEIACNQTRVLLETVNDFNRAL